MKRVFGPLGVAVLLALAGIATGCGETIIDSTKTEEALQSSLSKSLGAKVTAVDCPSDVEVEAGAEFTCNVEVKGGEAQVATLKIRNEDADISVIKIAESSEDRSGSNE